MYMSIPVKLLNINKIMPFFCTITKWLSWLQNTIGNDLQLYICVTQLLYILQLDSPHNSVAKFGN